MTRHQLYPPDRGVDGQFLPQPSEAKASDIAWAKKTWEEEVVPTVLDETYDGPTTIMLSVGYADVWADGDVTASGRTLFNVSDGGL